MNLHFLKKFFLLSILTLCSIVAFGQTSKGLYVQQGDKYFLNDTAIKNQGQTVRISGDGNTMVIGTQRNGVIVYGRQYNRWILQSKLKGLESIKNSYQGAAISISYDGNTLLIGAPEDNDFVGAAWIFKRINNIWNKEGLKLVGQGNIGKSFQGISVSIASDGNTAIVGAYKDSGSVGAAWIYVNKNDIWVQQGNKISCPETSSASGFGFSVSLSKNGNSAIIAGPYNQSDTGAAWIYNRIDDKWLLFPQKIVTSADRIDRFGIAVTMDDDAKTIFINSKNTITAASLGFMYNFLNNKWVIQPGIFVYDDNSNGSLTPSAIAGDGNSLIVGYNNKNIEGKSNLYNRLGSTWPQNKNKFISGSIDQSIPQAFSVSLSKSGSILTMGGSKDNNGQGAAYVFQQMPLLSLTSLPHSTSSTQPTQLKYNLNNTEGVSSPATYINHFISNDTIYNANDIQIGELIEIPTIVANGTIPLNQKFLLPANTSAGKYYVLSVIDANNVDYQYNPANLIGSIPLTVGKPDLKFLTSSVSPISTRANDSISISSTITNSGTINTGGSNNVAYCFSSNNILDIEDVTIARIPMDSLAAGKNYTLPVKKFQIPNGSAPGKYYIFLIADKANTIDESDENNNVDTVVFNVSPPLVSDLSLKKVSLNPAALLPGESTSIFCTVVNNGNTPPAPSTLAYFFSKDSLYDGSDVAIGNPVSIGSIPAGDSVKVNPQTWTLPSTTTQGLYYILFYADQANTVNESSESNNVAFVKFSTIALPDLRISAATAIPSSLLPGDASAISFTVSNSGISDASEITVVFYVSSDAEFNTGDTEVFKSLTISRLDAGKTFTIPEQTYQVPANAAAGAYYILAVVDKNNFIVENNELNNIGNALLKVGSFADLLIANPTASPLAVLPGDSVTLSTSVINLGSNSTSNGFKVKYFLSENQTYETTDVALSTSIALNPLVSSGVENIAARKFVIPVNTIPGNYYIIYYADIDKEVKEVDKTNNYKAIAVTIIGLPDFTIADPKVSPSKIFASDSVTLSCSLVNNGGKSTNPRIDLQYFLSTDLVLSSGDKELSSIIFSPSPEPLKTLPIAPQKFLIPAGTIAGAYYLLMVVDGKNDEKEALETNNLVSATIDIASLPDLKFKSSTAATSVFAGDSIRISATILNSGSNIQSPFQVQYFFSTDPILDSADKAISGLITIPSLGTATESKLPIFSYKIPTATVPGPYSILIYADSKKVIRELNEGNNVSSVTFAVTKPAQIDLKIMNAGISKNSVYSGDSIAINCDVKNIGTDKATAVSSLNYFLSNDNKYDAADKQLNDIPIALTMINSGASDIISARNFQIPINTNAGKYYVLFVADKENLLVETDKINNTEALILVISARADLALSNAIVNPAVIFEGDSSTISCTISNLGSGNSPLSVNLQYYLSKDKVYDTSDVAIGNGIPVIPIAGKGEMAIVPVATKLPKISAGEYFIILFVDNGGLLNEGNKSNNVAFVPITIKSLPDLRIINPEATPKKVFQGDSALFTATVENIGRGKTDLGFRYQFFLSKNKTYESSDLALGNPTAFAALAPGGKNSTTLRYKFSSSIASGTYYILAFADAGRQIRESDEGNNIGIIPIQVGNVDEMDLEVKSVLVILNTPVPGQIVTIETEIINKGKAEAAPSKLQYYLSTDQIFDNSDISMGDTLKMDKLPAGEKINIPAKNYVIPLNTIPGTFYMLSVVDVTNILNEVDEENNVGNVRFIVRPLPDLKISNAVSSKSAMFIGDTTRLSCSLTNIGGSETNKEVAMQYFISTDQFFDGKDSAMSKPVKVGSMEADIKKILAIEPVNLQLPQYLAGGYYYILAVIDSKFEVREFNEANNVKPILLLVKPRPIIIPPNNPGDTLSTKDSIRINIGVKSEFPVSRVNFTYKKPTDSTAVFSKDMPLGGPYTGTVPRNFLDEIGAEYAFYAIDSVGSKSLIAEGSLTVNHPRGVKIPYNSYGKEQRNYRIISVPLVLKYNRVDSMLHKSYGKYNDKRFRIYNYTNGSNIQFTNGLTEIKPGKGYWFISKDSSSMPFVSGEGRTVAARMETPFSVELQEGWNQIGNPYNMDMYWNDILNYKKNNKNALDGFKKWEGDWASGEVIKKMEGGFVLAKSPTTLYFPTQKRKAGNKALRIASFEKKVDELNWEVLFLLQSEEQTYRLAGIGMDEQAKASRDDLDDLTPPRFLDYLEINFNHPEYYYPKFTKDMIPGAAEHIWEFTVESQTGGLKSLSWDNSNFNSTTKKLMLYDQEEGKVIDMEKVKVYNFESGSKKLLKVYYGSAASIERNLTANAITLGNASPNPFSENTTVNVSLPTASATYNVELAIYNAFGQKVKTLAEGDYKGGFYEFTWNGYNNDGEKQSSGLYVYKLNVIAEGVHKELSKKVMVR